MLAAHPQWAAWYSAGVRFLFPVLAFLILTGAVRSLWSVPHEAEVWAKLSLPNGEALPVTHWENILGRSPACDVALNYPTISRQHAALIREGADRWTVYDLNSRGGVTVNGKMVHSSAPVVPGDTIALGGVPVMLLPLPLQEARRQYAGRQAQRPAMPWGGLCLLTLFQLLTCLQLIAAAGAEASPAVPLVFLSFAAVMWVYFLAMRALGRVGFEMERIAFFLSTLSLAVVASSAPAKLPKQLAAILAGLVLFLLLCGVLRDLDRVRRLRWAAAAGAMGLLVLTLALGSAKFGATNWIALGPLSLQPSELAKVLYIFAGAATLERLFRRRNIGLFICMTGVCMGALALMSDFGTAAIFFATFLVIAYLRSGDLATLALICGGAVFAVTLVLRFKPYILNRFSVWGHAWSYASSSGYQQVRTMSAAASGGLVGVGAGRGWLQGIGAADTDLVFGMLCEEWGVLIAVLAVGAVLALAVFAVRACRAGRSSYYAIAACAAASLLVFQTGLNVLGAVDLLPLTGVTFPFVSNGGSAMVSAWGLLAFLKAADTRPNASLAIPLPPKQQRRQMQEGGGAHAEN